MTRWNWTLDDWPDFTWDASRLASLEVEFAREAGLTLGAYSQLDDDDRERITLDILSEEGMKTSEIEGEYLDRDSLQSSLRRAFGLTPGASRTRPAEDGLARMMTELYREFAAPLDTQSLWHWHELVMAGSSDVDIIGGYRTHPEPMQVVSGPGYKRVVHFEALPSDRVPAEMTRFIKWFDETRPDGPTSLAPLTRAGIAHLWFESIHPFEDGNGRLGRAISEKALAQGLGQPSLIALSRTIRGNRKEYYAALQAASRSNEVTDWLIWFARTAIEARAETGRLVAFLIEKARVFDHLRDTLNGRQEKALLRMFRDGPDSFTGGMNAEKYMRITGAARATATRDLVDLVEKGALTRTGERRYTRYWLAVGGDRTGSF